MRSHHLKDTIFRALARFPSLSPNELIAEVYQGINEPEYARTCIHVTLHRMNKMDLPFFVDKIYRCGKRYRLVFK